MNDDELKQLVACSAIPQQETACFPNSRIYVIRIYEGTFSLTTLADVNATAL